MKNGNRRSIQAGLFILAAVVLSSCSRNAESTPIPETTMPASTPAAPGSISPASATLSASESVAQRYGFPAEPDPGRRYIFYLHGRIIEEQGLPAVSPEYGEYRYEEILQDLQNAGFVVISEVRDPGPGSQFYIDRTKTQIQLLLDTGVPPGSITIIGASMGGAMAVSISNQLGKADLNYVIMGTCASDQIGEWIQQGLTVSGNILSIYEASDTEYSGSCGELFTHSEGKGLSRFTEITLHLGSGHGYLYQPLDEWLLPAEDWANQE
ncbi:MAG: hypothetical protein JXA25_04920 [Anaerolineales bacterium]|nr:hypothetical protein [Anaerolineales bacterium]